MYIEAQTTNQSIFFNFKSPLLYILCIHVALFLKRYFLFQVENLKLITNLKKYYFYAMLIAGKCAPLYNKLDYNIKNEPPYLQFRYPIILKNLNNFDFFFPLFFWYRGKIKISWGHKTKCKN